MRTSYIICGAQCKMTLHSPFVKNEEFQDDNSRGLSQALGPSEYRALCDCVDYTALKLGLAASPFTQK